MLSNASGSDMEGGERWTMALLSVAVMLEKADEVLVPAVYAEMSVDLKVGLTQLGALTMARALLQALAAPLAAFLALNYNRGCIIGVGAAVWAVSTALVGLSSSFQQAALARAANGLGLAVVAPAVKSLVADFNEEEKRGIAFGWLHGAGQLGTVVGGLFATLMGDKRLIGMAGWRVSFLFVACLSLLLGICMYMTKKKKNVYNTVKELLREAKIVFTVKTFWVIVAQGVVGSMPWAAMLFFTLWMELLGFGNFGAATNVALFSIGNAFGSVFGGWVGDKAASYFPDTGRIFCSQFSAGVGIPLSGCLLLGLPKEANYAWAYSVVLFSMGFLMSWNSPATNWPIFSEIVPTHLRTSIYAIDMAIENSLSAVGTPLVGFLSERVYGYKRLAGQTKIQQDQVNAQALAHALFVCIAVPFAVCVLLISLLYFTYPKDRDLVKSNNYSRNIFELESIWSTNEEAGYLKENHGYWSGDEREAVQPLTEHSNAT